GGGGRGAGTGLRTVARDLRNKRIPERANDVPELLMTASSSSNSPWPPLPLAGWRDTYATLHMWSQIVGKLSLAMTPLVNHWWNVAFHLTGRGLATPPLRAGARTLTIRFDFIDHMLLIESSDGGSELMPLAPRTV